MGILLGRQAERPLPGGRGSVTGGRGGECGRKAGSGLDHQGRDSVFGAAIDAGSEGDGGEGAPGEMRRERCSIALRDEAIYDLLMPTISVKLADELLTRLTEQAKARRVTKSWLIREGLVRVLSEQAADRTPSCYDLASDLAGAIKGLPKDLATNPKYMEGFGR